MKSQNYWVIETLLIEAHWIIHNHATALVCGLCEPEDLIRIAYPPRTLDDQEFKALAEKSEHREIQRILTGQLSGTEISLIWSMEIGLDDTKKQVLQKMVTERFSSLIFQWLNLFDGTSDPRLVQATDTCAAWLGAKISAFSQEATENKLPHKNPVNLSEFSSGCDKTLQTQFRDSYQDFNLLISSEPYTPLKVKNFENNETIIKTLMLEAYCEIEIQSQRLIEDVLDPDLIELVYPLDETNKFRLAESEKLAIRSIGLRNETVKELLRRVFADSCYDVISRWLRAFDSSSTPFNLQKDRAWNGAKISATGYRYPDMLHDAFYELWHEYIRLTSQPSQRPF
jgi:hypothetical protein